MTPSSSTSSTDPTALPSASQRVVANLDLVRRIAEYSPSWRDAGIWMQVNKLWREAVDSSEAWQPLLLHRYPSLSPLYDGSLPPIPNQAGVSPRELLKIRLKTHNRTWAQEQEMSQLVRLYEHESLTFTLNKLALPQLTASGKLMQPIARTSFPIGRGQEFYRLFRGAHDLTWLPQGFPPVGFFQSPTLACNVELAGETLFHCGGYVIRPTAMRKNREGGGSLWRWDMAPHVVGKLVGVGGFDELPTPKMHLCMMAIYDEEVPGASRGKLSLVRQKGEDTFDEDNDGASEEEMAQFKWLTPKEADLCVWMPFHTDGRVYPYLTSPFAMLKKIDLWCTMRKQRSPARLMDSVAGISEEAQTEVSALFARLRGEFEEKLRARLAQRFRRAILLVEVWQVQGYCACHAGPPHAACVVPLGTDEAQGQLRALFSPTVGLRLRLLGGTQPFSKKEAEKFLVQTSILDLDEGREVLLYAVAQSVDGERYGKSWTTYQHGPGLKVHFAPKFHEDQGGGSPAVSVYLLHTLRGQDQITPSPVMGDVDTKLLPALELYMCGWEMLPEDEALDELQESNDDEQEQKQEQEQEGYEGDGEGEDEG